jgi:hypothetical protein
LSDALAALRSRLADNGRLVVFITKRNWLTRLVIGRWWKSNVYSKEELLDEFERAGFSHVVFTPFPLSVRYLAVWGNVIETWNQVRILARLAVTFFVHNSSHPRTAASSHRQAVPVAL